MVTILSLEEAMHCFSLSPPEWMHLPSWTKDFRLACASGDLLVEQMSLARLRMFSRTTLTIDRWPVLMHFFFNESGILKYMNGSRDSWYPDSVTITGPILRP
ncbi:hypothetical protein TYRP_014000 [Tyrophagus putrescentiae]|nr:hypothetical protein TYRP_014000 [Tyrophagus putrescentiae]